jgi:zinc protease
MNPCMVSGGEAAGGGWSLGAGYSEYAAPHLRVASAPVRLRRFAAPLRVSGFLVLCLAACKTAQPAPTPPASQEKKEAPKPPPPPDAPTKAATPVAARPLAATTPVQIVKVVTTRPVVSLRLAFRTGSIDDPAGKEGLTALTSRLVTEGGTKSYSAAQLLEALYPLAAELDASTDKELTVITARVHKEKLDAFLKVLSEVLLEPRFDPKELDRLKLSALNDVKNRLRSENDELLGKVALDSVLYAGHPYGHYVQGTVQGLTSITLDDVKAHYKKVFTQDRLILGLAGAVDAKLEKAMKALAAKLPAKGADPVALPPAPGPHGQTLIIKKETASTAESFGFSYDLRRGDPDYFPVALAASYLGEHRQSHGVLFNELREKRGLNYGDYAYAEHFEQDGWSSISRVNIPRATQDFSIWIRPVEPKNGLFAARGALFFLDALLHQPIPEDKLKTASGFLVGYTRSWEETDQRRLGWAIDDALYATPGFLEQYRAALGKLTAADVQAAAARHIDPASLNFVFVTKDADALAELIRSREPSPITYASPKPEDVLKQDEAIAKLPLPIPSGLITVISASDIMER